MKRGGGLNRNNKPLKPGGNLERTGSLKPRSDRIQKLYEEQRIPLVKRLLTERVWCQACPVFMKNDGVGWKIRKADDCHEILTRGRSGGVHGAAWLDENNILTVCRTCHIRITNNPKEATQLGLLTTQPYQDTIR